MVLYYIWSFCRLAWMIFTQLVFILCVVFISKFNFIKIVLEITKFMSTVFARKVTEN